MLIEIWVEESEPPVGLVAWAEQPGGERFAGWLGLLAVLSHVLDVDPAAGRGGNEFGP